jgi:hypothetical protein
VISAQAAISKTRRDLTLGALLRWVLLSVAIVTLIVQPMLEEGSGAAVGVLFLIGAIWFVLSFRSMRGSRMAADSSHLIAAGQYELAEQQIAQAVDSFSIFRTVKLMTLHHLATLRHAQNRWQDAALLCRAILTQRLGASGGGLDRSSRLILAESLLELGDLQGVHENIARLYDQRLALREALNLLTIQLDYLARIGAWGQMFGGVMHKVELAELLPPMQAARAEALLALAAKKLGRTDWSDWLKRRVELLADVQKLCTDRPMLWELWQE